MTKLILSKLVFENEIVLGIEFPDANTLPVLRILMFSIADSG
tara:strand:+ start:751 stop:876 length:126 start_codon:yes stop_codon:yes gene_type:complete